MSKAEAYNISFGLALEYYALYDIDGDGTDEFIIHLGDSEAGAMFYVYTFKNNKAEYCGSLGGAHSGLYVVNGELYRFNVHMGNWEEYKISLENGVISEELTFSKYYEGDYEEREGIYIEMSETFYYTELVEKLLLE